MKVWPWLLGGAGLLLLWPRSAYAGGLPDLPADGRLSDIQVAHLLAWVGWEGDDLETAVRIVLGESGGNANADNPDSTATGLFQILASYHPGIDLWDPVENAKRAYWIYKKQGGFKVGKGAWWGPTKYHTLKSDGKTPDTDRVERARAAVEALYA